MNNNIFFKEKIGITETKAREIAVNFISSHNPTHWDGSGEVVAPVNLDVYQVIVDDMYDGCTIEIQMCKEETAHGYVASVRLYEGGFWTGHGQGDFDKSTGCYNPGSVSALSKAIMRICMTYENLTNFHKIFVESLSVSQQRLKEIKKYTDGVKKQEDIESESVIFADGMHMDVSCMPRENGPSWCEAAIYRNDEDIVTSEPQTEFCGHWVCQTPNATYHLYVNTKY